MPEKLMRWNGSEWIEVACVNRQEVKDTVILTALSVDLQNYYETEKFQSIPMQYIQTTFTVVNI